MPRHPHQAGALLSCFGSRTLAASQTVAVGGATWPALRSVLTLYHTATVRRTTAKRVSRRAPRIHLHAHALQRLSLGWRRRLSVIRGRRHLVPPSLPPETDTIGAASARGVASPQSPALCGTSPQCTLGLPPCCGRTPLVQASDEPELARATGAPNPLLGHGRLHHRPTWCQAA